MSNKQSKALTDYSEITLRGKKTHRCEDCAIRKSNQKYSCK